MTPRRAPRRSSSRRALICCSLVAALLPMWATSPAGAGAPGDEEITDPGLLAAIEAAADPAGRVPVEVVTGDTDAGRTAVHRHGGVITGEVDGELLQASVRADRLPALAAEAAVQTLRRPLVANRPAPPMRAELGPVTGENVDVLNASAWHAAGLTGAGVKVGVIDFFDMSLWNVAEHGPIPDLAHRLCKDSSGAGYCQSTGADGAEHGVAVVEVLRDVAPDVELFLATVGTTSDLMVAIDWFAANGVTIVSRSLGAAYDGPGDGTGPLAAVVDAATAKGITWFNSAGNDAAGAYGRFVEGVDASGYVDLLPGPGVNPSVRVLAPPDPTNAQPPTCLGLDGVRWNDWGHAPPQMTDYAVEVWIDGALDDVIDARQALTGQPLEGQDYFSCVPAPSVIDVRIRRVAGGSPVGDIVEIGLFSGELSQSSAAYSAAKPVVDSRSPAMVSVGAVDPPGGGSLGFYSSQGPTNDGRTKPEVAAPSCVASTIYAPYCFNGTSAATPSAAGMAALLSQRGLAGSGAHLAALTKHLVVDLGVTGPDNSFGAGRIALPAPPPPAIDSRPAQYTPLSAPSRILDTRAASSTPGARIGPHPQFAVLDLPIPVTGATAAAVSIVSVDSIAPGYVQAVPKLMGTLAASSNLNVASAAQVQPNFAIVPIGVDGSITLYLNAGGNVVVDLLGTFSPATTPAVSAGRFMPVGPVRILDTRPESGGPVPAGFTPHMPAPGEAVRVTGIPVGASAAVVNVAADQALGSGFLRAQPTGAQHLATSNGNYTAGLASGTLSIVPVGPDGTISIYTSEHTHIVVDLMGYFTDPSAVPSSIGLFVPVTPTRAYDSRTAPQGIHAALDVRTLPVAGPVVPAGASAVSMNLTSDAADGPGFLTVFPTDQPLPTISNLNYPTFDPRANAGIVRLGPGGAVHSLVNRTTHVIIDVNGYFTGTT